VERLLQYLDDIDDLVGALRLFYEPVRRLTLKLLALAAGVLTLCAGFLLTLSYPLVALGLGLLLLIALVFRTLTAAPRNRLRQA
jgi:prolipoprotein diacylglyceryltransferase